MTGHPIRPGFCALHGVQVPCLSCALGSWGEGQYPHRPAPTPPTAHKLNTEGTAAIAPSVHWIPVGPDTPRGASMWLINKASGVSQKGKYDPKDKFFDFWFPNPTFKKD